MTTLREAAQQALETLEDSCTPHLSAKHYAAYDAALAALKAALEQPEHKVTLKPVFYAPRKLSNEEVMAVIGPFRREQPEQDVPEADCGNMEPVAWWNPQYGTDSYAFSDEKSDEWRVPLYTHPTRRLTDEVIADLWHKNGTYHHHFARAIERWLKGEQ